MSGTEICENVLGGFAVVVGICLVLYALVAIVLEFIPDAPCGCTFGCGTCAAGLARVARNRRWGKRVLATLGVLVAYALLASTCAGCVESCRTPNTCAPAWQRVQVYDGCTESIGEYHFVCVSPDGKIEPAR